MAGKQKQALKIGNRSVTVSSLEKPMFPAAKFTKGQLIDFYIRISKYLLPHLKDRPVTLKRYPDGIQGEHFYEKDAPGFTPEWVRTFPVPRRAGGNPINYIIINDLPTLVWAANLANIELHPFLHRVPKLDTPTYLVLDLDPGEPATVLTCARVAFLLRDYFDELKLQTFPKVSGSKGIQIYVPLNTAVHYDVTLPFAHGLAQEMERQHPDLIVSEMAKFVRAGKVFIDWSQNSDFKTTVGVYSVRAKRQTPFVSMPVTWDELDAALKANDSHHLYFHPDAAIERLEQIGDLFAPVLKLKQKLPKGLAEAGARAPKRVRKARTTAPKSLETYRAKRDFTHTPEPAPAPPRASHQGGRRRFVIQKHAASHLHYDFRLELAGVLKSWAVPKGVPYAVDEKRLAMATEDHPIDYLDFEGTIPQGQYGGGTVMVWDIGTYEIVEGNYWKGRLHIFLEGRKLQGEWLLVRDAQKGDRNWSLIKTGAAMKPLSVKKEDASALTGRTMKEIAAAGDRVWQSNRAPKEPEPDVSKYPQAAARFIAPMRARLVSALPDGESWRYEIKLDGYRALALKNAAGVTLLSRNHNVLNDRFPAVADACGGLADDTVIDGEVVALDENGRPSFNLLQNARGNQPVVYYVFDLLVWRGHSLLNAPLNERRALLEAHVMPLLPDPVRLSATLDAAPRDLIRAAKEQNLEGIVAKRATSVYEPGQRSGAWVKYRTAHGQELVIGGYLPGPNAFESLLAGYYEGDRLLFIGKIKNGFTPALRREVAQRFRGLGTTRCPFANLPEPKNARRGKALTAEVMKECCWLKPKLVAQVEFTDWTAANHLRHSRFIALRDDVDPREVHHEVPEA